MRRRRWTVLATAVAVLVVVTAARAGAASHGSDRSTSAAAARPLYTGFLDPDSFGGPDGETAFARASRAGARFVRVGVSWGTVAPRGAQKPAEFDARDPQDIHYVWTGVDVQVRRAVASGQVPIVYVQGAPGWARRCALGPGPCRPDPAALADFVTAAARRYGGGYPGLPRVRYWQVWNEPNLNAFLTPQVDDSGRAVSPELYRAMVNAAAGAIHAVHADNVVIAGGTAPFGGDQTPLNAISPLLFMRRLLCLSDGPRPRPVCRTKIRFDVWAHHPYTSGGPTHHATARDDISVPDLWKMKVLLDAAVKAGIVVGRRPTGFWVTEFAWDTSPPDPKGVPERLHARWVAEALYRMWSQGVSVVVWFLMRDQPFGDSLFQSGLYFRGAGGLGSDAPKRALAAFRFPFVAFRRPKAGTVAFWGRSPAGAATVVVERSASGGWRVVKRLRPNRYGIFSASYPSRARTGLVRARLANGSATALPFSLVVPPDRPGCVWGTC